jgi:hypothetical protein
LEVASIGFRNEFKIGAESKKVTEAVSQKVWGTLLTGDLQGDPQEDNLHSGSYIQQA